MGQFAIFHWIEKRAGFRLETAACLSYSLVWRCAQAIVSKITSLVPLLCRQQGVRVGASQGCSSRKRTEKKTQLRCFQLEWCKSSLICDSTTCVLCGSQPPVAPPFNYITQPNPSSQVGQINRSVTTALVALGDKSDMSHMGGPLLRGGRIQNSL